MHGFRVSVAGLYLSSERNEMVFAQTRDVDVSDDHHLVMVFCENGAVDHV